MVVVCLLFSLVQVLLHVLAMPNRAHGYNAVTLQFLVLSSEIDFQDHGQRHIVSALTEKTKLWNTKTLVGRTSVHTSVCLQIYKVL